MRDDLSHLPQQQQVELERAKRILMEEFEKAIALGTQGWKRGGRILKIIVHDLDEVNQALKRGEYFWADIVRDGIVLYELPNHPMAAPIPVSRSDALQMARRYFDDYQTSSSEWLDLAHHAMLKGSEGKWPNKAAFNLHQATETIYACYLLTSTFYFPKPHNIKFIRSLAEDKDAKLIDAWPRATKSDRRRFEQLKRAYVEARHSPNYEICIEDLDALYASVKRLRDIVTKLCETRIAELARNGA